MKVAASALLVGAASAAVAPQQQQQILKFPDSFSELKESTSSWSKPLQNLEESLKSLTGEARAVWDEVAMMFPESFEKAAFFSQPKPHTRKQDSEWDHIIKGADIQSVWVENENGEKQREIDGQLEQYSLRAKKVDPSVLGVDKVKQYSGYLDDDDEDKHLFYCEYPHGHRTHPCI
ncbi:Carboxypeptidase Y A [Alternaria alternata]|nr:Carboxypeptidase Y A [Alternaria alternata]